MNWGRIALFLVPVAALLWMLGTGFGNDPHALPEMLEGKPAPAIHLKTLEGKTFRLEDYKGKPVVLNFWATFCEPCKAEHVSIQRTAQAFGERVQFVGIVYQEPPEVAAAYLKRTLNTFPQLDDPSSERAIAYGVSGVPETFIISAEGIVVRRIISIVNAQRLRQELNELLDGGQR